MGSKGMVVDIEVLDYRRDPSLFGSEIVMPVKLRKKCKLNKTKVGNLKVQSYTSLKDIIPYSTRKTPWWRKLLARPSPDFATNLIVVGQQDDFLASNNVDMNVHAEVGVMTFFRRMFCMCFSNGNH